MLAYVQSYRSQDGCSCSGASQECWRPAGRVLISAPRQATTIRIYRPSAAS